MFYLSHVFGLFLIKIIIIIIINHSFVFDQSIFSAG